MWQGLEGLGWGWIAVASVHLVLFWVLCAAVLWLLMARSSGAAKAARDTEEPED